MNEEDEPDGRISGGSGAPLLSRGSFHRSRTWESPARWLSRVAQADHSTTVHRTIDALVGGAGEWGAFGVTLRHRSDTTAYDLHERCVL